MSAIAGASHLINGERRQERELEALGRDRVVPHSPAKTLWSTRCWGSTEELASRVVAKRLVLKRIGLPLTFIPAKGHGNVRRLRQWFRGQAWQAGFAGRKAPIPARGGVPCTGWGGGKSLAGIYI